VTGVLFIFLEIVSLKLVEYYLRTAPVAACFVTIHSRKAQAEFIVFFEPFEISKRITEVMCHLPNKTYVYYLAWPVK